MPQHQRDGAEHEGDYQRRHHRTQADAALGGIEAAFHRGAEPLRFAAFLGEGLHNADGAQHFGNHRAHIGDAILAGAADFAHLAAEHEDRNDGERDHQQHHQGEARADPEHITNAADAHHRVAQRQAGRGADHLFDDRGVRRDAAGDFGWAVFFEEHRIKGDEVALHGGAQIGHHALADPRDEEETHGRRQPEQQDEPEEAHEEGRDIGGITAAGEAIVYHGFQPLGDGQRGQRGDAQRGERCR